MAAFSLDSKPQRRKFKSTWYANILGTSTLIALALDLFYVNLYQAWGRHMFFKTFGTIQGLTRMYMVVVKRRPVDTPNEHDKTGFNAKSVCRYCPICQINVENKDHHCWFLSTCISKTTNHGDFVIFLMWCAIGTAYTIIFHCSTQALELVSESTWLVLMLPGGIYATLLGYISLGQLLSLVRMYAHIAGGLFSLIITLNYYKEHMKGQQRYRIFQQSYLQWVKVLSLPWLEVKISPRKDV